MAEGDKNTLEVSAGRKVCVFVCVKSEKNGWRLQHKYLTKMCVF